MLIGRIFYIETMPYIVLMYNDKAITRKIYKINKNNNTCVIRLNNEYITVKYY